MLGICLVHPSQILCYRAVLSGVLILMNSWIKRKTLLWARRFETNKQITLFLFIRTNQVPWGTPRITCEPHHWPCEEPGLLTDAGVHWLSRLPCLRLYRSPCLAFKDLFYLCICVWLYVCHICASAWGGQKGVSDPWSCKLPSLGARNQIQAFFMFSVCSWPLGHLPAHAQLSCRPYAYTAALDWLDLSSPHVVVWNQI